MLAFAMAQGTETRQLFVEQGGVECLLSVLENKEISNWAPVTLSALGGLLTSHADMVEPMMVKRDNLAKIVQLFFTSAYTPLVQLVPPLVNILTASTLITHVLACNRSFVSKFAQLFESISDESDPRQLRALISAMELLFSSQRGSLQSAIEFVTIPQVFNGVKTLAQYCAKKQLAILLDHSNEVLKQMTTVQEKNAANQTSQQQ